MGIQRLTSLRQLQTFHTVARLGSVTLAADELHLSQSAVSIQIGELERHFNTELVLRTGRGVRLTDAGDMLNRYADRMLAVCAEANDDMAVFLGEYSGTLKIGAVTTAEFWLPRLLVTFANEHPKAKVKLRVEKRDEIVRMLTTEEIDLAVMGQPPGELNVAATAFAKNTVGFVAAPRHLLMSHPKLTMAVLAESRLLVREPGSGTRATVERLFKEQGLRLRIGSELSGNEALKQMCAAGFGPAYLSLHTCVLEFRAGLLALLPMPDNPFEREWFAVHLAAKRLPPVALAFERFLVAKGQHELSKQLPKVWRRTTLRRRPPAPAAAARKVRIG